MDMLYYIYIGSNRVTIDHLSKIAGGMFMAVSSCNKAAKVIDGIRERYNTSILYEESTPQKDSQNITFLHKRFPRVYIILITEGLQKEHRKLYLQAGVNNTLSPMASEESLQQMTKFLQLRKEHKLQEFSQSHRKIFNTFHLPMWKRIFDILFDSHINTKKYNQHTAKSGKHYSTPLIRSISSSSLSISLSRFSMASHITT